MAESFAAASDHWEIVLVVMERDGSLVLVVEPTREAVPCPKCGELSRRQHSSYDRRPLDLPWRGHTVRLRVHSRRWFCDVPDCPREIFYVVEGEIAFLVGDRAVRLGPGSVAHIPPGVVHDF